jgi:hypothetical protein
VFLLHNAHEEQDVLFHTRWAMSYLRGPLTRNQIKRLSPPAAVAEPKSGRKAAPKASTSTEGARPVVAAGIEEVFLSDQPGTYRPHLIAEVGLHYSRSSQGLDEWEEHIVVAPLLEGLSLDDLELFEPDALDVEDEAPDEAEYVTPSSGSVGKGRFRSYGKQIKTHLYQGRPKVLWRNKALKLQSKPGESKGDFSVRLRQARREKRDAAVEKLRQQYGKKIKTMQGRVGRAEDKVEREKSQYGQQKLQTGISMGATVLGAIFGSRAMGRATSAARGAGRVAREREDVRRAEESLEDLQEDLRGLEIELEEEARELEAEMEAQALEAEEVIVRPKKADIRVTDLRLAWKPD